MNNHTTLNTTSARKMPLALSMLSAGPLVEMSEDHELLDINELITGGRDGFAAYIVTGESMVDEIRPGQMIFVDTWAEPVNKDIVVSCVNGLINVKIFQRRSRNLYLVPKNPTYATQAVKHTDDFHILGVVKGHMRIY